MFNISSFPSAKALRITWAANDDWDTDTDDVVFERFFLVEKKIRFVYLFKLLK